jgi:hypothetical protein
MKDEADEQPDFQDADHHRRAHEIGGDVEHFASVVSPDAGIHPDVNDQKKDQEDTRKAHYKFLAYGGSKEFRPCHNSRY